MSNPIGSISEGLFGSISSIVRSKEGITVLFLIVSILILILWLTKVIIYNGALITLFCFIITGLMCWITWVGC